jgi:archaeal flagellar protein FlaJ
MNLLRALASHLPDLKRKLRVARLPDTPEYYLRKTVTLGALLGLSVSLVLFGFLKTPLVLLFFPILWLIFSVYIYHYVDVLIQKEARLVNQELVYATRYLLIQIESGIPLYATFENLGKNYEHVGKYFREINEKMNLGTPLTDAINETIETVPSDELRKILWQILNSLRIGSEITASLQTVLDQVVREQKIAVVEYGRKLNPIAMLYMMMAIIMPSLGTVMLIVLATFIGFQLSLTLLLVFAGLLFFVQLMFLAVIKSQRPAVEL